ncbi:MAG: hypothetical protein QNJ47_26930 [Nostocaceae cyanobacterium]|nr:hypothetical protein [Nostocaceae cyanobacterium]
MGTINEEAVARSKEEEHNVYSVSRRTRNPGGQSESDGSEQERADRTHGSWDANLTIGNREKITGGILRQLIEDCRNQEAIKLEELKSIRNRLQHLEDLLEELEQPE